MRVNILPIGDDTVRPSIKKDFKSAPGPLLQDLVSRFASVLNSLEVTKGDQVIIYMPMVSEPAIAMLAYARIGTWRAISVDLVVRDLELEAVALAGEGQHEIQRGATVGGLKVGAGRVEGSNPLF